jgi:hypothetical protein
MAGVEGWRASQRPGVQAAPRSDSDTPLARPGAVGAMDRRLQRLEQPQIEPLQPFTVATAPDPARFRYAMIFVTNEAGGAVPAFSDGVNWRRVTDRAVIS